MSNAEFNEAQHEKEIEALQGEIANLKSALRECVEIGFASADIPDWDYLKQRNELNTRILKIGSIVNRVLDKE